MPLLLRALLAFLAFPGLVAGLVPFLIAQTDVSRGDGFAAGYIFIGVGLLLLIWCVVDFYIAGKGTLNPSHPPRRLVTVGLYRWGRNPMYVAVLMIVLGWALVYGSMVVGLYWIALAITLHLRVVQYEEPALLRQFGSEWSAYAARTPRWLPGLKQFKRYKPIP